MSSSSICDNKEFCEQLPKNEVVVMEDSETTQDAIRKVLEKEFDLEVKIVESKEEAISFAENKELQYYILDVNMGNYRRQEGLDALEVIKKINENSFVSILTGCPTPNIEKMASNLKADLYKEKSFNLEDDIREIALQIKQRKRKLLKEKLQIIDELREDIVDDLKKLDDLPFDPPSSKDTNIDAYEKLKLDEKWFAKYKSKYVAFIDGELVGSNEDEQKLIKQLKSSKYQDRPIFFTKVEENSRIVDLPSSLWFDDF